MAILMQIFWGSVVLVGCSLIHLLLLIGAIRVLRKMAGQSRRLRSTYQLLRLMIFAFAGGAVCAHDSGLDLGRGIHGA